MLLQREGCFPAFYDIEDLSPGKKGVSPLDPNHSHFILVDDGTHEQAGKEIDFRAAFEQYLAKKMEIDQGLGCLCLRIVGNGSTSVNISFI